MEPRGSNLRTPIPDSFLLLLALLLAVADAASRARRRPCLWLWLWLCDWRQATSDQADWETNSPQSGGMRSIGSTLTATVIVSSARPFQTPRFGGTSGKSRPTAVTT